MLTFNIYVNAVYKMSVQSTDTHHAKVTYLQIGGKLLLNDKITAFEQDEK